MLKNLSEYENDELDSWDINVEDYFKFRTSLYEKEVSALLQHSNDWLTKIEQTQGKINRLSLLLVYDRGYIYEQLLQQTRSKGMDWVYYCEHTLKKCSKTVNQSILFYKHCFEYPRLLVSQATASEWYQHQKEFIRYIEGDASLVTRFQLSLKNGAIN